MQAGVSRSVEPADPVGLKRPAGRLFGCCHFNLMLRDPAILFSNWLQNRWSVSIQ
jgi:hypothetical protein